MITDCLNIDDTQNYALTYLAQQPNVMESETCCLKPTHCSCLPMSVKVQNRICEIIFLWKWSNVNTCLLYILKKTWGILSKPKVDYDWSSLWREVQRVINHVFRWCMWYGILSFYDRYFQITNKQRNKPWCHIFFLMYIKF